MRRSTEFLAVTGEASPHIRDNPDGWARLLGAGLDAPASMPAGSCIYGPMYGIIVCTLPLMDRMRFDEADS